ncbi:MAG: signal peptidase I [Clostridium butyricum]|nr:signal peptidase I [Clostridium butyricum]
MKKNDDFTINSKGIEVNESLNKKKNEKEGNFFKDWIVPIFAALVIAILINKFIFFNVYVPTGSMIPTINENDKILVTRVYNTNNIERGDIIVFYSEELQETLIKRAIGLPGDHIEINNGIITINGEVLEEDYVKNNDDFSGVFDVPEGKFFFLGDNRANSNDARLWINSYIDGEEIKGEARFRFYPFNNMGTLN